MKLTLAALLTLALAGSAMAETITVTGQNGGTSATSGTCHASGGQLTCNSATTVTGPNGGVSTRARGAVVTRGEINSTVSGTRVGGQSFSRKVKVTR